GDAEPRLPEERPEIELTEDSVAEAGADGEVEQPHPGASPEAQPALRRIQHGRTGGLWRGQEAAVAQRAEVDVLIPDLGVEPHELQAAARVLFLRTREILLHRVGGRVFFLQRARWTQAAGFEVRGGRRGVLRRLLSSRGRRVFV